jgi:hypothetical protein
MIDTNLLNNASNILVQAGYTIKAAPIPEVYSGALTAFTTFALAALALIAAAGRAWQAWKTGNSSLKGIFMGTNAKVPVDATVKPPDVPKV